MTTLEDRSAVTSVDPDLELRGRRVDAALFLGVLLPYVLLAWSWARSEWFPIQDQAVLAMRLEDLSQGRIPLLGAFSRYGWSHPGPIWFYVLAPFRMLGGDSWMAAGSIVCFGAGPATLAVLTRRRFGSAVCAVALIGSLAAILGAGSFAILVPWNPHLAFAWLPVFLVLCTSAADGRVKDLALAALVGAALIQLHVGYLVLVGILISTALLLLLSDRSVWTPRDVFRLLMSGGSRPWWGATAVLWFPPLIEQLVHGRGGNFWQLGGFFLNGSGETNDPAGWSFAFRVMGGAAAHSARVVGGGGELTEPYTGWVLPGSALWTAPFVVVMGVATVVAIRSQHTRSIRAVAIAGAAMVSGFVALGRLLGDRWPYLFVWRYQILWFAAAASVAVIVGAVLRFRASEGTGAIQRALHVAIAVLVALSAILVYRMASAWEPGRVYPDEPQIEELSHELLRGEPPELPVTLVRFGSILVGVGDGVLHALRQEGWDVGVLPALGYKYGTARVQDPADDHVVWLVTETSADTTVAAMVDGAEVLAVVTPLDEADEEQLIAHQRTVMRALVEAGRPELVDSLGSPLVPFVLTENGIGVPSSVASRLAELNQRVEDAPGGRMAVVEVPADTGVTVTDVLTNNLMLPAG